MAVYTAFLHDHIRRIDDFKAKIDSTRIDFFIAVQNDAIFILSTTKAILVVTITNLKEK